jgi:gamma-glutamyltranspeptidase/glutathione hydrolase
VSVYALCAMGEVKMWEIVFKVASRLLLVLLGCSVVLAGQEGRESKKAEPVLLEPGLHELATSRVSMVSAAHPYATKAGLDMLRRGGNAMDAAIAATMVTAVVDQELTSLAGGGELTYYDAKTKKTVVINCEPNRVKDDVMPYTPARDGTTGRSIAIPGSFACFGLGIRKYGALPWRDVVAPSIYYAENGFPVYGGFYAMMLDRYLVLTSRPTTRRIFAPTGFLPAMGSIFKQPELAETLKKIAEHEADYFYKGPLAAEMAKAIQEIGGKATVEDFASYSALEVEPLRGTYKGYTIVGAPPPSMGGVAIIEALNILENVDLKGMGHYSQSADSLQWIVEALRVVQSDTIRYSGVPELDQALTKVLTSKEYGRARYQLILHKIEVLKRQASEKPAQTAQLAPASDLDEEEGTNHVSVVDKEGNVCSFTHTTYGFATHGLFVGGIVLNQAAGRRVPPGEHVPSAMTGTIVFKGDKPYFATGSSGGAPNAFYTLLNVLAWDKNLKEAQEAPRLPNTWGFLAENDLRIPIEHRIDEKVAEELTRRGYHIDWLGQYSQGGPTTQGGVRPLGGVQMVGIDLATGMRYGATDPRGVGVAAGQ